MDEKIKKQAQGEGAAKEVKATLKNMARGKERYLHEIFEKAYNDKSYAEQLMHDPELLKIELNGESLAEVIAVAHPSLAMEKIVESDRMRDAIGYTVLAKVVSAVVEFEKSGRYSRTIIEKYPDLLYLVDSDSETDYTVAETIAIRHPELKPLLNAKGFDF